MDDCFNRWNERLVLQRSLFVMKLGKGLLKRSLFCFRPHQGLGAFNTIDCADLSTWSNAHRFSKAQVTQIGVFMQPNIFVFPPWSVSYTHLDVYKRQGRCNR